MRRCRPGGDVIAPNRTVLNRRFMARLNLTLPGTGCRSIHGRGSPVIQSTRLAGFSYSNSFFLDPPPGFFYPPFRRAESSTPLRRHIMLSRIIVSSYKPFIEIALWLTLLVSIVGGWQISRELFDGSFFVVIFVIAVWFIMAVVFLWRIFSAGRHP